MAYPDPPIEFERTGDMQLVCAIMTLPGLYEWTSDDGSPSREEYHPPVDDRIWYVLAREKGSLLGLWMLVPRNRIEYEVHTNLLPGHGYKRARRAARAAIDWAWANVPNCRRLVTAVPAFNRIAYQFAVDSGFKLIGVDEKSFRKHGTDYDQALMGLSPTE